MDLDYVLNIGGEEMNIEYSDNGTQSSEQIKRLKAYYLKFLQNEVDVSNDPKKAEILKKLSDSLSNEGTIDMMAKIQTSEGKNETIEAVKELIDVYEGEETDEFVNEEINGNFFEYKKSLDIDSVRNDLSAIGEQVKGKAWSLEIDENGKAVLCE